MNMHKGSPTKTLCVVRQTTVNMVSSAETLDHPRNAEYNSSNVQKGTNQLTSARVKTKIIQRCDNFIANLMKGIVQLAR